jgi:hypothetical protein
MKRVDVNNLDGVIVSADSFYFFTTEIYRELKRQVYLKLKDEKILENDEEYPLCLSIILFDFEEVNIIVTYLSMKN